MYYGPNYDTSSTGVVPPVSSAVSPPPDEPTNEELCKSSDGSCDDDDNDDDWITPDNLHRAREQMGGAATAPAKDVTVGCLTTDFSMQVVRPYVCTCTYTKIAKNFIMMHAVV